MIFLFPLALSVVGVLFFLVADVEWKWKFLAGTLLATSLVLQFVPDLNVHFLVPLGIQIVLCLWMGAYWKLE
jgi:hypothetical protein